MIEDGAALLLGTAIGMIFGFGPSEVLRLCTVELFEIGTASALSVVDFSSGEVGALFIENTVVELVGSGLFVTREGEKCKSENISVLKGNVPVYLNPDTIFDCMRVIERAVLTALGIS